MNLLQWGNRWLTFYLSHESPLSIHAVRTHCPPRWLETRTVITSVTKKGLCMWLLVPVWGTSKNCSSHCELVDLQPVAVYPHTEEMACYSWAGYELFSLQEENSVPPKKILSLWVYKLNRKDSISRVIFFPPISLLSIFSTSLQSSVWISIWLTSSWAWKICFCHKR